ncbi:MAG: anthrone oxygenase family protein [Acidobacteriota bacterium]
MLTLLVAAAATGSGLVTGLLFAFSNFVMRALGELPNESGMIAMQRINEYIINPIFLIFFLGTPALCAGITLGGLLQPDSGVSGLSILGAVAYLIGPFGITVVRNVPLNNQLASRPPAEADSVWPLYQRQWQLWNHIRTAIGVVATGLLAAGLATS